MNELIDQILDDIVKICGASKIVLYGEKKNRDTLREISLLVVVKCDPKEAERALYRAIDREIALNLLVYSEEDYLALMSDETSYVFSIMSKGRVLYG